MCQNHSATKKMPAASHTWPGTAIAWQACGHAAAINGAAISSNIMCCAIRAENRDTDSAHSGEMKATAAMAHPPTARARSRELRASRQWTQASKASATIRTGSRLKRVSSSPGWGGAPQYGTYMVAFDLLLKAL